MEALQKENHELRVERASLQSKCQSDRDLCSTEKNNLMNKMNQTNADLQKMHASLEKCKAQIFDMQPLEHLTDSELKDQYKDLCDTIGVFAELQFGDSDNPLQELLAAVPPPQLQHPVQTCFTRDGYIELVKKFPEAGVSFIRCLLARYSYCAALDEQKYYPGLGAEKAAFLAFLEQALSTGPAKRGKTHALVVVGFTDTQETRASLMPGEQTSSVPSQQAHLLLQHPGNISPSKPHPYPICWHVSSQKMLLGNLSTRIVPRSSRRLRILHIASESPQLPMALSRLFRQSSIGERRSCGWMIWTRTDWSMPKQDRKSTSQG